MDEQDQTNAPADDASDPLDPRGLIREAYRIEGVTEPDCRSIFFDWALGLPDGVAAETLIGALLARYGAGAPDHPMTKVLREGMDAPRERPRRGRRRS